MNSGKLSNRKWKFLPFDKIQLGEEGEEKWELEQLVF